MTWVTRDWPFGRVHAFLPEEGAMIGVAGDPDRCRHFRRMRGFGIRADGNRGMLFVTRDDVLPLLHSHRYQYEFEYCGSVLREPAQMASVVRTSDSSVLTKLRWEEADALCRLLGGRLPGEAEMDLLLQLMASDGSRNTDSGALGFPVWTSTWYSRWSYRLAGFQPDSNRWEADASCVLPDVRPQSGKKVVFAPRRDQPGNARLSGQMAGVATGRSRADLAAACLVFDPPGSKANA